MATLKGMAEQNYTIKRNGLIVGTIHGFIDLAYPDIIALPHDAPVNAGDVLVPVDKHKSGVDYQA